jgi:phage terminase small subunit
MKQKCSKLRPLTARQRKAADHYLLNGDKTAAYRSSFSHQNQKDTSVNRNAHALFALPHVAAYVEAAQSKAADKAIFDRAKALLILSGIAEGQEVRGEERPVTTGDQIKAIERIAKLEGWDQPEKVDLGGVSFHFDISNKGASK